MKALVTQPAAPIDLSAWGTSLTREELDGTVGGAVDPLGIAVLVFAASVVVGIIDRLLFGGCRCR